MPDTFLGLSTEQWRDIVRSNEMTGEQVRNRFIRYRAIEDEETYWVGADIARAFIVTGASDTLGTTDAATRAAVSPIRSASDSLATTDLATRTGQAFTRSAHDYLQPDYRTLVLAESTLASYIRLGDANGASTVVDSVGSVTGTVGTGITLGVTGLVGDDANTAAQGTGTIDFGDNYDFANNTAFTVEFILKPGALGWRVIGKADGSGGWSIDVDATGHIVAARRG